MNQEIPSQDALGEQRITRRELLRKVRDALGLYALSCLTHMGLPSLPNPLPTKPVELPKGPEKRKELEPINLNGLVSDHFWFKDENTGEFVAPNEPVFEDVFLDYEGQLKIRCKENDRKIILDPLGLKSNTLQHPAEILYNLASSKGLKIPEEIKDRLLNKKERDHMFKIVRLNHEHYRQGIVAGILPDGDLIVIPNKVEYLVKKDNTLFKIAERFLGIGTRWKELGFTGDPKKLPVGTVLNFSVDNFSETFHPQLTTFLRVTQVNLEGDCLENIHKELGFKFNPDVYKKAENGKETDSITAAYNFLRDCGAMGRTEVNTYSSRWIAERLRNDFGIAIPENQAFDSYPNFFLLQDSLYFSTFGNDNRGRLWRVSGKGKPKVEEIFKKGGYFLVAMPVPTNPEILLLSLLTSGEDIDFSSRVVWINTKTKQKGVIDFPVSTTDGKNKLYGAESFTSKDGSKWYTLQYGYAKGDPQAPDNGGGLYMVDISSGDPTKFSFTRLTDNIHHPLSLTILGNNVGNEVSSIGQSDISEKGIKAYLTSKQGRLDILTLDQTKEDTLVVDTITVSGIEGWNLKIIMDSKDQILFEETRTDGKPALLYAVSK